MRSSISHLLSIAVAFICCDMSFGLTNETQCLNFEALLEVSYEMPTSKLDAVRIIVTNADTTTRMINETVNEYWYPSNNTFALQTCISRDIACGQVKVFGPPKNHYKISWDGQVLVDTGPELKYDWYGTKSYLTAIEFGDGCVPECGDGEGLFENQYRTTNYWDSSEPYHVNDKNGNKMMSHDNKERPIGMYLYIERKCLPKNDCYRYIMGDDFAIGSYGRHDEHASISFDGKTLFEKKAWFYESFEFGDGCPITSSCDPNEESVVELFVTLNGYSSPLSWELTVYNSSGTQVIRRPTDGDSALYYDRVCVPKGSCVSSSLFCPNDINRAHYQLSMDKTIYRKNNFWPSPNPDVTYLGDCSKMKGSICTSSNEALLELNFHTMSIGSDPMNPHFPNQDTSMRKSWYVAKAVIQYSNLGEADVVNGGFFHDYELDTSYKTLQCIPDKECIYSLFVHNEADFAYYSIKLDGVTSMIDPYMVKDKWLGSDSYEVTPLNDDCNEKGMSSSGSSFGTMFGVTFTSLAIIWALISV